MSVRFEPPAMRFYTPEEVRTLFRMRSLKSVYRAAACGFLRPFARRFDGRHLLFDRAAVDRLIDGGSR